MAQTYKQIVRQFRDRVRDTIVCRPELSYTEIAKQFGISEVTVHNIAAEFGVGRIKTGPKHICLRVHRADSLASRLDMLLFASTLIERPLCEIETTLRVHLLAGLSLWDPQLCEYLTSFGLSDLLEPRRILRTFARQRAWSDFGDASWINGKINSFEGSPCLHSALLTDDCHAPELNRRIWRAEVGVLLPYVEEQRILLVEATKDILMRPGVGCDPVPDPQSLEIGRLCFELQSRAGVPRQTLQRAEALTRVRNDLAHLRVSHPVSLTH